MTRLNDPELKPTVFDHPIHYFFDDDDERMNWLVAPVSRTRDSGPLDISNFEVALNELGGESETVEVHRFGHWGPGWYEIIIASDEHEETIRSLERALEDYPVLDDMDYSEREHEEAYESWLFWAHSEFVKNIMNSIEEWADQYEKIRDALDDAQDDLFSHYCDHAPEPYHEEGGGVCFPYLDMDVDEKDIIEIAWAHRPSVRRKETQ